MASPADDSVSMEELRSRVGELEEALKEQEQNLFTAATAGKSLLDQNTDLRNRIDDLMKQHADAMEEKQQEVCSQQSRLEVAASTDRWQQEEISNLRAELLTLRTTVTDKMEEEKRQEVATYKKQLANLNLDLDSRQTLEAELRGRIFELEALLQSHLDRTAIHSTSASFTSEEMAQLHEEVANLRIDLTEERARVIEVTGQLQQAERERETLSGRLRAAATEVEELQCQVVTYARHLEEARRETLEVRTQLEASRVERQSHDTKGNSLFSEVEDRRMVLEKMMASLKVQNQQLKEKYDIERQQNQKYKMQVAMALRMSGGQNDPSVQRLRDQLNQAHAEIRTLTNRLQSLEATKDRPSNQVISIDCLEKAEDRNYAQYLLEIIKVEKDNAAKARSELHTKSLQFLDASNQLVGLTHENQQLQAERRKLQSDLVKSALEKEELLLKYEPERVKGGKLKTRVVEKIDMGEGQLQMQEKVTGPNRRGNELFKACPTTGRPSWVFKTPAMTGRPSDVAKTGARQASEVLRPLTASQKALVSNSDNAQSKPAAKASSSDKTVPSKPSSSSALRVESTAHHSASSQHPPPSLSQHYGLSSLSDDDESLYLDDKENINFDDTTFDSDLSLALPPGRKVSMAEDVKVIGADGEVEVATLARDKEKSVPAETMTKKKEPKATRKVKHISEDNAPEFECKQQ